MAKAIDQHMSTSLTGNPYSCFPLDTGIEMTMNKHSKMKAGWKYILKKMKKGVQDLANCIAEFECDPFDSTHTVVTTLHSGEVASFKLEEKFATAHTQLEKLVADFFKERIFSRDKVFDATMPRNWRGGFTNQSTSEKSSNPMQNKAVEMEHKVIVEVVSLSAEKKVSLEEIMNHWFTDECLSIFNTNRSMVKVQRSKLVQMLHWKETPDWQLRTYISILWRFAAPLTEDRERNDGSPFTWKDYSPKLFNMICMRHPRFKLLILVNDSYNLDVCIKDLEHDRCNTKKPHICSAENIVIRANNTLPSSKDLNDFFKNNSNKIRLQQFLKAQFTAEAKTLDCDMIYSIQDECCSLVTGKRKELLERHHIEAETIIFYIYAKLREKGQLRTVIIDAEDTDVVVLAAYVAHKILCQFY